LREQGTGPLAAVVASPGRGHGDPDVGKFEDAKVLKTFGDLSVDLTMLF
jgi:hypothetical protein